jgi:hypothetical protein
MNMRVRQIHPIPFDCVGHAADEDNGTIRFYSFHNTDVCERIVVPAVSIGIPRIVKKHQVAGMHQRPPVNTTPLEHVVVDKPDAVRFPAVISAFIEVDPMRQINCTGDAGTIIRDAPAIAFAAVRTRAPCSAIGDAARQQSRGGNPATRGRSIDVPAQPDSITIRRTGSPFMVDVSISL